MDLMITSEVRVYRLSSRVDRANLSIHDSTLDLYIMNAERKVVRIQGPSIGIHYVGDVHFLCIGDE